MSTCMYMYNARAHTHAHTHEPRRDGSMVRKLHSVPLTSFFLTQLQIERHSKNAQIWLVSILHHICHVFLAFEAKRPLAIFDQWFGLVWRGSIWALACRLHWKDALALRCWDSCVHTLWLFMYAYSDAALALRCWDSCMHTLWLFMYAYNAVIHVCI